MSEGDNSASVNEKVLKHDGRINHLEQTVEEIKATLDRMTGELRKKSENDVRMAMQVDNMVQDMSELKNDVKEMSSKLLDALIDSMAEDKKERSEEECEDRKSIEKEKERMAKERRAEIEFYRKLVLGCLAVGGTLILSAYSISKIIPIFSM